MTKEEICVNNVEHLLMLCKLKFKGQLLKPNMKIVVPFYGRDVCFTVKHISSNCNEESILAEQIEDLSIGSLYEKSYFLVVDSTNWEITINKKNNIPSSCHKEINFNKVGGYDEIKQELFRAVCSVLKNDGNPSRKYCC